jgi:hypothetical protein
MTDFFTSTLISKSNYSPQKLYTFGSTARHYYISFEILVGIDDIGRNFLNYGNSKMNLLGLTKIIIKHVNLLSIYV